MSEAFKAESNGAGDETRTRDPQLGRLMLYQLSYSRIKEERCWALLFTMGAKLLGRWKTM